MGYLWMASFALVPLTFERTSALNGGADATVAAVVEADRSAAYTIRSEQIQSNLAAQTPSKRCVTTIAFDALGRIKSRVSSSETAARRNRRGNGSPRSQRSDAGAPSVRWTFEYDLNGRLRSMTDPTGATREYDHHTKQNMQNVPRWGGVL